MKTIHELKDDLGVSRQTIWNNLDKLRITPKYLGGEGLYRKGGVAYLDNAKDIQKLTERIARNKARRTAAI